MFRVCNVIFGHSREFFYTQSDFPPFNYTRGTPLHVTWPIHSGVALYITQTEVVEAQNVRMTNYTHMVRPCHVNLLVDPQWCSIVA